MRCSVGGNVTIVREKDVSDNKEALLRIKAGTLTMENVQKENDQKIETKGRWSPSGELKFNFEKKVITEATLTGAITIEQKSLDHIIFQMKYDLNPRYEVQYSCEMLPGDRLKDAPTIKGQAPAGTLDRLKGRAEATLNVR